MNTESPGLTYHESGVANSGDVLQGLLPWVTRTLEFRRGRLGENCLEIGFYANVLNLGPGVGLAISTDGVGTKILIAEMMNRYDTIGIDCVAMNVNDLICVGAEPLAMLDYIAVQRADARILEEIGKGLFVGAEDACISIPGGELAQLGTMIGGLTPDSGVDLVGTCVGVVLRGGRPLIGDETQAGDRIIGLASSGVHSNGLTLARESLFVRAGLTIDSRPSKLAETLGEELLKPTTIYVRPALEMIHTLPGLRALAHITSDGLLNLLRIPRSFRYVIDALPPPPPIFELIQECGNVSPEEMYRVYNMGIGLCAVVSPADSHRLLHICEAHGLTAWEIGHIEASDTREVVVESAGLRGSGDVFHPM